MKLLVALVAIFGSFHLFAGDCQKYLDNKSIGDFINGDGEFKLISKEKTDFPTDPSLHLYLEDFSSVDCKDAMVKATISILPDLSYDLVYTNEDECDGGNSYGYVLISGTNEPVATIEDTDIYCF
jgi:hypothetical protein